MQFRARLWHDDADLRRARDEHLDEDKDEDEDLDDDEDDDEDDEDATPTDSASAFAQSSPRDGE